MLGGGRRSMCDGEEGSKDGGSLELHFAGFEMIQKTKLSELLDCICSLAMEVLKSCSMVFCSVNIGRVHGPLYILSLP